MTALVLKARSRWIMLAPFQERVTERTVSWKRARGATGQGGKSALGFVKARELSQGSNEVCQTWKRQISAYPGSKLFMAVKLYGFVCFVLNHLLRQDRACEALPANAYPHWYGNIGGREEGGA